MGCCTSQEVGVANAPRSSWFSRHGFATTGFGFGANATAAANQAAAAAILRAEHAGTFSVRSIGLIMAARGGDEVEEEVKERSDKEEVRFSKLQPASAVPAPFMTARLESSEPLSTRPVPKRPLGMCTYILARDKRRGGRAWASPAVGNTVEMSARDIRVGDDAIVVDAWMLDEQHSYYHLGAGLLGIRSLVESAHADMNHGISTLLRVDLEIRAGDTQQLVGHWSLEVRFVLAQAQPGNLLTYDHFPNRADKYHRVGPAPEPAAGNVRVTALNASLLQPDKQDDDETFLSFQCGKAERLVERPAGDPAFSCAGRLGSEPVWCSGGVDVLGATVLAQVRNLNPSLAFLYVDAWERDGGAGGAELPVASGAIKLGPLIAAARYIGGTGRLSLAQVPLFKKMKPRRSRSGKLSAATGMVPWGLAELEVRFESSAAPPKATVLRQVTGHFTFTSLHAEMLPGGEELEWEKKKEASKPFLAVSLERRTRLSARRDPRNPQHVCTGNVMDYCKAAVVSAADAAASATAAAAVPGAPAVAPAAGHPGHVFTSQGRQQAGASMFLHPSSEDKVTLGDFALYFEAWSRLPSDEGSSRKRGGASSECKFLGVGTLDLRPLVEAASRGQGLGVRIPVRLQLYTRRGTKRTGTWVLEASFASPTYEPAADIDDEDVDTRPPLGAVALGALPRNVHTSSTGHFVMRVRRAKLESQYTRGWQVLVKACLEKKDELIDRAHTTRGPRGKGKRRGITAVVPPVQVNKSGVASWKSVPVHTVLMELPASSICVDKHTIFLEVWGSDADNPMVLAVGSLGLRHLVQRAVGPEAMAHGFGAPHKVRVPLFYNAHGVIHPDGELEVEAWYESDTRSHKGAAAELLGLVQVPGAKLSGNIQVRVARAQIKFPRDQRGPMRLEDFGRGFMCFHVDLNMDVHDRRKPEQPTDEFCTRDVASGGRAWSWGNTPGRLVTIPVQQVLPDEISLYCEAWVRDADAELVKLVGVGKIRLEEFMLEEDLNRGARTYVEVPLWFDEYTSAGEVFIAITFADERSNAPVRRRNKQRRRAKRRSSATTVEPELTAAQKLLREREPDLSDSSRGTSDSDTDSEGETKRVESPDLMMRFGPAARAAHALKRRARKPASPPRPHRRDRSHMFDSDEDSVVPPPVRTKGDAGEVKGDPTELDTPLPTRKGKRRRSKTRNKAAAASVVDSDEDTPIKAKPASGRTEEEEQKWKKALQERRRAKKRGAAKAKERRGEGDESKASAKA